MRGRPIGWGREDIGDKSESAKRGAATRKANKEELDLDLGLDELDEPEELKKKTTKKKTTKKKTKKKTKAAAPTPEEEDLEAELLADLDLADDPEPEKPKKTAKKAKKTAKKTKKTKKAAKKKAAKKAAKKEEPEDDLDLGLADDPTEDLDSFGDDPEDEATETPTEAVARAFSIDLSLECPVCRSTDPCSCEEADRSFVRRVRFEDDVEKVARCARCRAPMSVVYLPRPGAEVDPPAGAGDPGGYRLSQFAALHACSVCHGDGLAAAACRAGR